MGGHYSAEGKFKHFNGKFLNIWAHYLHGLENEDARMNSQVQVWSSVLSFGFIVPHLHHHTHSQ